MELCPFMCYGHLVTRNLTFNLWSWQVLFRKSFFVYVQPKNKFHIDSQDSGLRTYSQSHPILNMNIEVKSSCDVTDHVIMVKMVSFYIFCHAIYISEVKLKLSCAKHGFWKFLKNRYPASQWLLKYLLSCCVIKTDRVMAVSRFHLLFDLVMSTIVS